MTRVVHKKCGGSDLGVCTLVPRTMGVASWTIEDDGSFHPEEFDHTNDDAFWDCEDEDPNGGYWCYACIEQFSDNDLEVVDD